MKNKNRNQKVVIERNDIPVIEIPDDGEYISRTKVIAKIHVKGSHGEIKRMGKFLRTSKGGYMFS